MADVDRDRLVKVLALLSSPVDGEALAAARKVVELLGKAGLRPESLVEPARAAEEGGLSHTTVEFLMESARVHRSALEDRARFLERLVTELERQLDEALPFVDVIALVERYSRPGSLNHGQWKIHEMAVRTGKLEPGAKLAIRRLADEEEERRKGREKYERRRRRHG